MFLCVELCKPSGDVNEDHSSTVMPPLQTSAPDGSHLKTNIPFPTPRLSEETNDIYSRTSIRMGKWSSQGIIRLIGNESRPMETNQPGPDLTKKKVTNTRGSVDNNPKTAASSSPEAPLKSVLHTNHDGAGTKPSRSLSLLWLYSKNEKTFWPKEKVIPSVHTTKKTPEAGESTDYSSRTSVTNLQPSPKTDGRDDETRTVSPTPYIKFKGFISSAIVSNGGNKPPISSPFTGSVDAVAQKSLTHPEASPSFIDPRMLLTSGIGSRTVLLQPAASKTQSQRIQNVSPTPTPYPTAASPYYCDMGSQSCICMNCEGNRGQGFGCCIDVIDQAKLNEGVMLSISSVSLLEFLTKKPTLQRLLGDMVSDHCTRISCIQDVNSKRLRRNIRSDQKGQQIGTTGPGQYIRSWDGSPLTPSNTIRPYSRKNSPIQKLLSTTITPPLKRPVDVKVVLFKIAPNAAQNKKLSTGLYVSVTSIVDGINKTYILQADILAGLIRSKRDVFKRKLNITIDTVTKWSTWRATESIGPRMAESATQAGFTTSLGSSVVPGRAMWFIRWAGGHTGCDPVFWYSSLRCFNDLKVFEVSIDNNRAPCVSPLNPPFFDAVLSWCFFPTCYVGDYSRRV
jgi:hypothetical protein